MNNFRSMLRRGARKHGQDARAAAFTVTELLVVITLIVILVLIAVPSFQAMIYSSEEGMAETHVRNAIRAARDAALRSNGGADGAAVFFFEPGGRTSILPCVKVGEITDWANFRAATSGSRTDTTRREIFAAAPGFSPVLLPRNWMVRGYVSANSFSDSWFISGLTTNTGAAAAGQRNWVFPETGFFDVDAPDDGYHRSTFMVRFQAGTGALVGANTEPVLVLSPRNSAKGRGIAPYNSDPKANREGMEDPVKFVRTWLAKSVVAPGVDHKRRILGRFSSDMVLARPVMQLAVYNERKLASALRVSLDRETGSVYAGLLALGLTNHTGYVPTYVGPVPVYIEDIDDYIEGDANLDRKVRSGTDASAPDHPEAKLFAIDRQTGVLRAMEVQP